MYTNTPLYIWQAADWPHWRYDLNALAAPLAEVSHAQGVLLGRLADVGMDWRERASLAALTDEVLHTSAIEGELLRAANKTPWRCCVTLPYCLYCLRSHA